MGAETSRENTLYNEIRKKKKKEKKDVTIFIISIIITRMRMIMAINITVVRLSLGNTHGIARGINIKRRRPVTIKIALSAPIQDIAKEIPRLSIQ